MVEVFKTNVQESHHSEMMVQALCAHFPSFRINFDLDDCDRILRVEGSHVPADKIIELLRENGFDCLALE